MDDLNDFMLFNACEDAREEQERSATSEYPYQKQFFQPSDASGKRANLHDDEGCETHSKAGSTEVGSGSSAVSKEGKNHSKLGCLLFVLIVAGVLAFLLFSDVMNSCRGNHDDGCVADSDSIEEFCTVAADPEDTVTSQSKDAVSEPDNSSNSNTMYSSGYYDDDEYDEDGMYKDEDEDIKEKREYDDYDDEEVDDWE